MAGEETLRDLVVSLSLNPGDFEKHIRLINKDIKKFESEFELAGAGIEGFEKTLKGMGEKAKLLKQQLQGQNEIVGQYQAKLKSLNEKLQEGVAKNDNYRKMIEAETEARDKLKEAVEEQRKEVIALTQAYGADDSRVTDARQKLAEYSGALDKSNESIKKAKGQQTAIQKTIYATGTAITDTTTALNRAQAEVKELTVELNRNEDSWYRHGVAMQHFAGQAMAASESVDKIGGTLTRTVTTPLLGLGAAAAKASIDYESAFAGVRKTVNVTGRDAEAFFEKLSNSAVTMSKELATGASDIADVMAIAGQLGIANDELASFTETVIRLGMNTDMAGEDAASSMARFANITGMAQTEFAKLGSTVVYLGNTFATTESEIMTMAMRIAAAGTQVGLSESQILGFSAALSSLGLEAEAGGSAFSKALKKMETAVATGSDALDDFAKVSGLTRAEFAEMWKNNPADAFQAFIVGLSNMDEAGMSAIATLDEIGITELRLSDTLLRTANATELMKNAQAAANTAWEDGTALMQESNTRLETTASRMTNIKNTVVAAGISFGDTLIPMLEDGAKWLENTADWFANLDEATRKNYITWGLWAAATGPVISGIGKAGKAFSGTINAIGQMAEAVGKANAAFRTTGQLSSWVGTLLGPGGAVVGGIAVATAAIAGLIAMFKRMEEEKPDFSIDTEEIKKYRIDTTELKANIDIETAVEIKGDILGLKGKFQTILNDGVPETQEIRDGMEGDIDKAVGEVFELVEESYNEKKKGLDSLYRSGLIDEQTYQSTLGTLTGQADQMKNDLTEKANAVTAYVDTLASQNRKTTQEEIDALNALLEALGLTAEAVAAANDAQMQARKLAYESTRLGFGDDKDLQGAVEYIEITAAQKLQEIEAQKKALESLTAADISGMSDAEKKEALAELEEQLKLLERQEEIINRRKAQQYREAIPGFFEGSGISPEELQQYLDTLEEYEMLVSQRKYVEGADRTDVFLKDPFGQQGYGAMLDSLIAFEEKLEKSGLLSEGSPLVKWLSTMSAEGLIPEGLLSNSEQTLQTLGMLAGEVAPKFETLNTQLQTQGQRLMPGMGQSVEGTKSEFLGPMQEAADEAAGIFPDTFDMHSPSKLMYQQGVYIMQGLKNGIIAGQSGVIQAMKGAALAAVNAAKEALQIRSPSRVFEDEIGAMAMKGFGEGITGEARRQAKIIRNAAKYLTGEAKEGVLAGGTDNRKTYNSESTVMVTGNTFMLNDRQDIEALAVELATLTQTQQRGRGLK